MDTTHFRTVRSYVRRGGRLTPSQKHGLDHFWELYGVDYEPAILDISSLFANDNPVTLEIGFGMGESLFQQARLEPQMNFIGIEVHPPGVGKLINELNNFSLSNVRVISFDAIEVMQHMIPDHSLAKVQLYFPDPWHKKKHHKRRIIQPSFLEMLSSKLTEGGLFHFATDWFDYHEHALEVVASTPYFKAAACELQQQLSEQRPKTRFEARGLRLGHSIYDHVFQKTGNQS